MQVHLLKIMFVIFLRNVKQTVRDDRDVAVGTVSNDIELLIGQMTS